MSTVIEKQVETIAANGSADPYASTPAPMRSAGRMAATLAPVAGAAAFTAAMVLARRRRSAASGTPRPDVDWRLAFLSGNSITFRPTVLARLARRAPRRRTLFR